MESIRKVFLIYVFVLAIIFIAISSYASMGGGHHMQNYCGNITDRPNMNSHDNYMNNQQFNKYQGMHNEFGQKNQNDHSFQKGMIHNNFQERNSSHPNNDKSPGSGMNQEPYRNEPGRN